MIVKNIPQVLVRAYELPMRGVMKRFFFLFVCFFVFFWEGGGGGGGEGGEVSTKDCCPIAVQTICSMD